MKNSKLNSLFDSKYFMLALSFVLAVSIWAVVVTFFSTEATNVIKDVPINFEYNASYTNLDLDIIEKDLETVDVTVTGPRSVVGALEKDDIIVYPQFTNVRAAGKYTLTLNAIKTSSVMEYEIASLSDYQVMARFDQIVEKTFDIDIDVSNLIIPKEYVVDKIYATPETVTIKGPESSVSLVHRVVATVEAQELTQTTVLASSLTLYNESGNIVNANYVEFDQHEYTVTVPVLSEVKLPVKIDFINVPAGFDTSSLAATLSTKEMHLAVPTRQAAGLTEYVAGYIDLQTLELDKEYVFDVKLANGYKNLEDVEKITATVSSKNIVSKKISVSEIKLLNKGEHKIEVLTEAINNVEIVGQKAVVDALAEGSVIAQIDLAQVSLAQGQQTVEVDIIIPSTDKAYARGTYTVTIKN
ncbi:MAG: hypothetical protein IKV52_05135 [Oscillospiraceae bacterium]|nr:hypothetical protein [Oscillospiraceae bacterium]